jgi:hypothetical protein
MLHIRVPYPVEVVKSVKAKRTLSGWQNFQVWCGRIALVAVLLFIVFFINEIKKNITYSFLSL